MPPEIAIPAKMANPKGRRGATKIPAIVKPTPATTAAVNSQLSAIHRPASAKTSRIELPIY